MLKVIIVDDEISVRSGLKEVIDWENLGYTIVADFAAAEDALDSYYEYMPDVIITDICMSEKTGLDLLAEMKQLLPNVEVIILTGYPDFAYAKNALENGAFAYLLKPLEIDELENTLKKLKTNIEKHRLISEQALFKILQLGLPTKESINAICQKYSCRLPDYSYFMIAVQPDCETAEVQKYCNILYDIFVEQLVTQTSIFMCQPKNNCISILAFCPNERTQNMVCALVNEIQESYSTRNGRTFTIGVSNVFNSIEYIRDAFLQSLFAISQRALKGYGYMIYYSENTDTFSDETLSTTLFITSEEIEKIVFGINDLNINAINEVLNNYFKKLSALKRINMDIIKNNISELAMQIIHCSAKTNEQAKLIFGKIPQPINDIQKLDMLSDMRLYLDNLINMIFENKQLQLSKKYSKPVQAAQIYIMQYYSLNISISSIAEHVHFEKTSLMRMFKNETGVTINEFLTNYRIQIAQLLIKSGKYQIQEISLMVGYGDAKYFSKVFKKITGYTPSEYIDAE